MLIVFLAGAVFGGTVGFMIAAALGAASHADDSSEYAAIQEAVKDHLEEKEAKEQVTKDLHKWASDVEQ